LFNVQNKQKMNRHYRCLSFFASIT
jgi:hypothetical protein